jgi:hypothetical protein
LANIKESDMDGFDEKEGVDTIDLFSFGPATNFPLLLNYFSNQIFV